MLLVLFKLSITPLLIGAASLAARRWGPAVGGWVVSLPLTSGPVALFVALDQGTSFAAATALASLGGCVAIAAYCLVHSQAATRWPAGVALAAALTGWLVAALAVQPALTLPVGIVLALVLAVTLGALRLMPDGSSDPSGVEAPRWELPLRMAVGAAVVVSITTAAPLLGSGMSGLLAMIPVMATVLAVFSGRRDGPSSAIGVLRGIMTGMAGTATFLAVVSGSIERFGIAVSFGAAVLTVFAIQVVALQLLRRAPASLPAVAPAGPAA